MERRKERPTPQLNNKHLSLKSRGRVRVYKKENYTHNLKFWVLEKIQLRIAQCQKLDWSKRGENNEPVKIHKKIINMHEGIQLRKGLKLSEFNSEKGLLFFEEN